MDKELSCMLLWILTNQSTIMKCIANMRDNEYTEEPNLLCSISDTDDMIEVLKNETK